LIKPVSLQAFLSCVKARFDVAPLGERKESEMVIQLRPSIS
jgi:hypothetical protein